MMRIAHGLKMENGRLEIILPFISGINEVLLKEYPADKGILMVPKENRRVTGEKDGEQSGGSTLSCSVSFRPGS